MVESIRPYFPMLVTKYQINTPLRMAHFMAQIHHESTGLTRLTENLNYSVEALLSKFSRQRISEAQCRELGRTRTRSANQREIANVIYGGTWGRRNLGNIVYGDGWKFRGRGPIQCTGKANYAGFSAVIGVDLVNNPDEMLKLNIGIEFAAFYWKNKGLNSLADQDNITLITRRINGGTLGLKERIEFLNTYKNLLRDEKFV